MCDHVFNLIEESFSEYDGKPGYEMIYQCEECGTKQRDVYVLVKR